jgi:nucleoid-associated protein YgaU
MAGAAAGAASVAAADSLASRAAPRDAVPDDAAAPGYGHDIDDDFYSDRDRFARDYGQVDDRADPVDRPEPKRRGLFGRDKRPKVGDTRRDIQEEPAWEQPRRYEAYPTLKTRRSLPISRLILAVLALGAAAVAFFLLPGLLGVGNPALPGASSTAGASPTEAGASVAPSTAESLAPTPLPTPTPLTYTIVRGDTLTKIAKKFGVTVEQILAANPQIKNANNINVGDVIVIPTGAAVATPAP